MVFGGIDYDKQRRSSARGVDVLIGTPGRLIDYFKQHVFDLRHAQVLVLDEADRMFDLGFIADIRYILRRLPPPEQRQSMLFSATLSHRVLELAYEHMNNPELVRIEPDKSDRRSRAAGDLLPLDGGEGAAARRPAAPDRSAPHHGIRQHQAHGRAARERAARQRLSRPGALGRRAAERSGCSSCAISTRASSRC